MDDSEDDGEGTEKLVKIEQPFRADNSFQVTGAEQKAPQHRSSAERQGNETSGPSDIPPDLFGEQSIVHLM